MHTHTRARTHTSTSTSFSNSVLSPLEDVESVEETLDVDSTQMLPYLTPNDQNDGPTEESTDSSNADTSHADTARADTSHADSSHAAFLSAWLNGDSLSFSKSLALNEVVSVGTSMKDGHHY